MADTTIKLDVDGKEHVIDLSFDKLTLQESVRVEELLGVEAFDRIMETGEVPQRPSVIRAVVYAKLKTQVPELTLDNFDLDLSTFAEVFQEGDASGEPSASG